MCNECRFKDRVQYAEKRVVQHSVTYGRLVNTSRLWVADTKSYVVSVSVGFVHQISVQAKDVLFEIFFKMEDVGLLLLAALEFIPRRKQSFGISNFVK